MKRHLNTLYVTTQGAWLGKEGETVVVRANHELLMRVPLLAISSVVCFGQVSCSPALMAACAEHDVALAFLSEHGRFLARVVGETSGNVLLRREQYRRADRDEATLAIARSVIAGKLANSRTVLLRGARDRTGSAAAERLTGVAARMAAFLTALGSARTLDEARGIEGAAAREYFAAFDCLVAQQKETFTFTQRSRRPPLDPINALLSFVYTILLHDVTAALESHGLDPAVGYLHRDRPGRVSLALDLMEELRSWFADRLVLTLINLRQVTADDFVLGETGAVTMTDGGRKTVLLAYQTRKQDELLHPFLEERTTVGLVPSIQALLLARHLRGDLDAYPPFVWK
jgi:CRISPR-associated protein Cas1